MGNSLRCCIACVLPFGALDVIRIVHCNGRVEELSGSIRAGEVMKANPKHVVKPCVPNLVQGIVILPPDAELERGEIYFLVPFSALGLEKHHTKPTKMAKKRKDKKDLEIARNPVAGKPEPGAGKSNDRYLTDILTEKRGSHRDRRRGRVAVWRPNLESISEGMSEILSDF
ncbi:hypothetical protein AMTRI_Chr08g165930 [Amborella trichopoda]